MSLDPEIAKRVPAVLEYLRGKSFAVCESKYERMHFGNFYVVLTDGQQTIRLINDRGQYFGETGSAGGEWEWIESQLKQRGVMTADLETKHQYDESRLLQVLKLFVES